MTESLQPRGSLAPEMFCGLKKLRTEFKFLVLKLDLKRNQMLDHVSSETTPCCLSGWAMMGRWCHRAGPASAC